jgi:maltooligosyltrehalose trehalohydrolase
LPPLPDLGARVLSGGGVRFTVWAPTARLVELLLRTGGQERRLPLSPEPDGYHTVTVPDAGPGDRYRFLVDDAGPFPDPASRFQPEGPHGPSQIVDPAAFPWTDAGWPGLRREGLVIYELHVGTFTAAGTFDAVVAELPRLRDLGVTAIELMPVAEFPGRWNWGYDGVDLFAPSHVYGGPDGLRRLVDAAHAAGLGVILDVVYNHLGPDGNYLRAFSPHYFTDRYRTPWGDALNYDGPHSRPVRDFVCAAACRWVEEYHIDGLRLDAVHAIFDASPTHILAELAARVRATAGRRAVVVIAESDANDVTLLRSPHDRRPGYGLDAVWADDFHHAVHVRLTGERDGYYAAYTGAVAEIARAVNEGFIYQGEVSPYTGRPRGTRVTDEPAAAFVFCIQNHDQVGNRAEGERLAVLVNRDAYALASALLLLVPETPLLFMGQEYAATTPFLYFTDHHPELGRRVTEGRRQEFAAFPAFRDPARRARIPDPQDETTFRRSKLDPAERARNAPVERLYRDLLALRREDPVLRVQDRAATRALPLTDDVLAVHRRQAEEQRLLLVNFGAAAHLPVPESVPLPPSASLLWCSRDTRYGGDGAAPALAAGEVHLPARCAALFAWRTPAGQHEGETGSLEVT